MQKKLIALAIAGLAAAPAFAQSNVTIYGVVDIGYARSTGSEGGEFGGAEVKSRNGFDSGMQSGSRIGFKGTEDLGNGLKAGFVLENSIGVDTGAGPSMTRQSFLTLSGGFGTVAVGRQYTPQFNLLGEVDPFGTGTVGDAAYGRGLLMMGDNSGGTIRVDNTVAYVSPSFGGFTVTAAYSFDAAGDEASTAKNAKSTNAKLWAISPVYKNGPLFVGLNVHKISVDSGDVDIKMWDLGATYDFKVVKLHGMISKASFDNVSDIGAASLAEVNAAAGTALTNLDGDVKTYMVGVSAPVGAAGSVLFSYQRASGDVDDISDDFKANKWALGYTHSLSKRTNLYAAYATIDNDKDAEGWAGVKGNYTKGLNLGIRHKF